MIKPHWIGEGWRRLTPITNGKLEKFRLNFSRCAKRDVTPLKEFSLMDTVPTFKAVFITIIIIYILSLCFCRLLALRSASGFCSPFRLLAG